MSIVLNVSKLLLIRIFFDVLNLPYRSLQASFLTWSSQAIDNTVDLARFSKSCFSPIPGFFLPKTSQFEMPVTCCKFFLLKSALFSILESKSWSMNETQFASFMNFIRNSDSHVSVTKVLFF